MSQFNNVNWQDAANQLSFAEQNIIQVQKKIQTSNNDPQEQLWLQQALGAVTHARDIISSASR